MSYAVRLAKITAQHHATDAAHPDHGESWRASRHATRVHVIEDAIGVDLEDLDDDESRCLEWLAGCDDTTVAGVAALLDRARNQGRGELE